MLLEDTIPPKVKEGTAITTLASGAGRLREISGSSVKVERPQAASDYDLSRDYVCDRR